MQKFLLLVGLMLFVGVAQADEAGPFSIGRVTLAGGTGSYAELTNNGSPLVVRAIMSTNGQPAAELNVRAVVDAGDATVLEQIRQAKRRQTQLTIVYDPTKVTIMANCWIKSLGYSIVETQDNSSAYITSQQRPNTSSVCYSIKPDEIIEN